MALSAAEWERVEALLPEGMKLPRPERERFLDRHCGDSPHLRAELESLLATSESTGEFLVEPISLGAPAEPALLEPGTRLGPWKVGERIGRGGMGEVFAAERADGQFEMDAALKILKRGLDTDELLRRFERERNILARLSHPNIARLLDAGATADHRPYYVMERVTGCSITSYCRERGLGVREVLALMVQICEAVDAAHRSLVVHRDLKPSNVLVTVAGEVKLLDFGVAKVMAEEGEGTRTRGQDSMLTPAYAAPEQMLGGVVSTAVDVYALGVMLFQLLTGRMPHQREGAPLATVIANLRDETTERPSRVAAREPRGRIRAKELIGDLDLIVLKALQSEPERRYRSAHDLGADLQRYLDHQPIEARPDSFDYRLRRFLQRHPLAGAVASGALLALLIGLGTALWQARAAREALATANAVSEFLLQDMLTMASPYQGPVNRLTMKDVLDRTAATVADRFGGQPDVAADVRLALGQSYWWLRQPAAARAQFELAEQLLEPRASAGDERLVRARQGIARTLLESEEPEQALALLESVRSSVQVLAPNHPRVLQLRVETALARSGVDRDRAIAELTTLVAEARGADWSLLTAPERTFSFRNYGGSIRGDELAEDARFQLGSLLARAGRAQEAEPLLQTSVKYFEQRYGVSHYLTALARMNLATVLIHLGQDEAAEPHLLRAQEDLLEWMGPEHEDVKSAQFGAATLRLQQGRLEDALASYENVARSCIVSGCAPRLAHASNYMVAMLHARFGDVGEATQALRVAVSNAEKFFGVDASETIYSKATLGGLLLQHRDFAGAAAIYESLLGACRLRAGTGGSCASWEQALARARVAQKKAADQ